MTDSFAKVNLIKKWKYNLCSIRICANLKLKGVYTSNNLY